MGRPKDVAGLPRLFELDVIEAYGRHLERRTQGSHDGAGYRGTITRLGAVQAARNLMLKPGARRNWWKALDGGETFTPELGIEYFIVRKKYRVLFDDAVVTEARKRMLAMRRANRESEQT